jgi:type I restriction enzyme R subunit
MPSNFEFLKTSFPALEKLGSLAESYLYTDPNACMYKLGVMVELVVKYMFELDKIPTPKFDDTTANRIKLLKREGMIPRDIDDILFALRKKRNSAVHQGYDSSEDAKTLLEMAHTLSIWFMQTYGDYHFSASYFALPPDNRGDKQLEKLQQENEILVAKLSEAEAAALSSEVETAVSPKVRKKRSGKAIHNLELSERETRRIIDEQLRKVGWEADTDHLRYADGTRPQKGHNLAIAEWPTNSTVANKGRVDYALFVGLKLIGIIEAKAERMDVSSVIDYQCREYSRLIRSEDREYVIADWNGYKAPFLFATNGRPFLQQYREKSGIWFRDARSDSNIAKPLQGWNSPEGLIEMLDQNVAAMNQSLADAPKDFLRDPDGLNLRDYQVKAIEAAEKAVMDGKQTALLAMATGTGKTRIATGMIYRFLDSGRFKRILFLVDRKALGEQAMDKFAEVKIKELLTLTEIYDVKGLEDKEFEKTTKVHIATVQSLVRRVLYNEGDMMPAISDYDLIIVDEAHRGYLLDKEMDEDETLYRDQNDFMSKYRAVIEYFDAVKIALTATPALQTTEIFGKPIYNYTYREAVIGGWLVDHDAPYEIHTKQRDEGIKYEIGETLAIYDPVTGEITNSDALEDEVKFDVETFNRRIITESFNEKTLGKIASDLDPLGDGKTLIYAVDDHHADMIVRILKEIFEPMGVPNDAIMKITGSVGGGNQKKVLETIKRFKNEKFPNIAVTVDLLTTGIDVPEITTIVFMRRVKSRILFEQMMGRATRLCDKIHKEHFEIYDAVGVYEGLDLVNTMKPVVQNESATFDDLLDGLKVIDGEQRVKNQIDFIIAKMQRKKRGLDKDTLTHFIDLSGGLTPDQFIEKISHIPTEEGKNHILGSAQLLHILESGGKRTGRAVVISDKQDEIRPTVRNYGKAEKPEDYLQEFNAFVASNRSTIAALNVVCTRPKELTRAALKSLKLELDRAGFREEWLNTAWREWKNESIAADIISYIRQGAIGSALIPHEERIRNAVEKLRHAHVFSKMERSWLDRMEKVLLQETVLDQDTFDSGSFKSYGGFIQINKVFSGNLVAILQELNEYLYDDGGHTA